MGVMALAKTASRQSRLMRGKGESRVSLCRSLRMQPMIITRSNKPNRCGVSSGDVETIHFPSSENSGNDPCAFEKRLISWETSLMKSVGGGDGDVIPGPIRTQSRTTLAINSVCKVFFSLKKSGRETCGDHCSSEFIGVKAACRIETMVSENAEK